MQVLSKRVMELIDENEKKMRRAVEYLNKHPRSEYVFVDKRGEPVRVKLVTR